MYYLIFVLIQREGAGPSCNGIPWDFLFAVRKSAVAGRQREYNCNLHILLTAAIPCVRAAKHPARCEPDRVKPRDPRTCEAAPRGILSAAALAIVHSPQSAIIIGHLPFTAPRTARAMARPSRRRKGSHQNPASSPASTASAVASSPAAASPAAPEYQTASEPIKQINARPHLERSNNGFPKPSIASLYSAFAQCTFPAWAQTATMIFLIFGGCCSNVRHSCVEVPVPPTVQL